ncbi:LysM peptidoglycan-binding domain-containing protein [Nisaea sp.]|uniref:LysM peptidoglycan-binding domain-containing protein n=1 Tax=Nisaea sp. TaxID=2024842 RepID=UPI0032EE1CF0
MFSKPFLIGAAGIVVLAAATGLFYWTTEEAGLTLPVETPSQPATTTSPAPAASPPNSANAPAASAQGTADAPVATEQAADKADLSEPSFDVVRVDPEGNTVIAGKAKPNAKVRIMDGEKEIGEVQADEKGDWVYLPEEKLPSGSSVLTLESDAGENEKAPSRSQNAVVVVIPEKGKDIAGRDSKAAEKPLAMVVPRDQASSAPTKVLQAPAAKPEPAAPAVVAPTVQSFPEAKSATAASETAGNSVTLDIIDYDDAGAVVFSGTTEPDSNVQIYVDNDLAARAASGADGNWSAKPESNIETGTHQVRVDKVSDGGQVLARIELPFIRAVPITGLPKDSVVIIQPGNNLWRIASRVYGSGFRYTEIYQANSDQIRDPDLIYPGQVFGLPTVN